MIFNNLQLKSNSITNFGTLPYPTSMVWYKQNHPDTRFRYLDRSPQNSYEPLPRLLCKRRWLKVRRLLQ